uniref:Exocyst subunit Exo70 family protein n=1 Tax=Salix viminalis TaxID=40686 RepID=A0A6N2K3N9_SALVM
MTTTSTTSSTASGGGGEGGGADDRVMATAQQIVNSLNTTKNVREDMLLILSSFDNHSGISSAVPWDDSPVEVKEYLSAVDEILDLLDNLSVEADSEVLDRAETAVQVAMSRLEDEFRQILMSNKVPLESEKLYGSIRGFSPSFASTEGEIDEEFASFEEVETESVRSHERGASLGNDLFVDLINSEACDDECLATLGVEKLSIEEVQKIEWKSLNEKMKKWVQAVKIGVRLLLRGERRLCDVIFYGSDSAREVCFNETAKGCLRQLFNFAEAVSIGRRSSEKLFRILDMYDALSNVFPYLEGMAMDGFVYGEAKGVLAGLGGAARGTFAEFENAVKSETSRKPTSGGEIHLPDTLNLLLENDGDDDELNGLQNDDGERLLLASMAPITRRLLALLSTLESNLEEKSRLYEDGAMQYIFLMNNILYMVQKVKDSELIKILGDQWVRKHRGQIRQNATAYLRAAWSKALSCLKDEGIGGVVIAPLKKYIDAKVPDPQLREELRISISEKVLPAYRSFMGRFGSQLESGRHAGKYIKYTPDDLENYLVDLFEGTPLVLHHLRRKSSS